MPQFQLGHIDDFPPGTSHELVIAGRVIAVYAVEGLIYALDGVCPHAGGPLGAGCLTGTRVTCPWHGWQFDVTTGEHCLTPKIVQERFEVVVRDGEVFVEIPDPE